MNYDNITYTKTGHLAWLTLNRPQVNNTVDLKTAHEIAGACLEINQDEEIRVVILTGAGKDFCAGSDLSEAGSWQGLTWEQIRRVNPANISSRALAGIDRPVIAAISGNALGAGLELALCCDIRIASEDARFGFPETSLGVITSGGGSQRLPRLVGKGKALEMLLTGDVIDAAEAYRVGLVSKVVPGANLSAEAEDLAKKIAARAPIAERYAKEAVLKGLDMTLDQGLRLEGDLSFLLQTTEDRAQGIKAFQEKKTAQFKGK